MVPPARETAFLPSFPQALVKVKGMTPGPPDVNPRALKAAICCREPGKAVSRGLVSLRF